MANVLAAGRLQHAVECRHFQGDALKSSILRWPATSPKCRRRHHTCTPEAWGHASKFGQSRASVNVSASLNGNGSENENGTSQPEDGITPLKLRYKRVPPLLLLQT